MTTLRRYGTEGRQGEEGRVPWEAGAGRHRTGPDAHLTGRRGRQGDRAEAVCRVCLRASQS